MIGNAFFISFKVVIISLFITLLLGIILNYILVQKKIRGKSFIETLILLPMFLPPSAVGYLILLSLGKRGVIGKFLYENLNISIIFTMVGAIIVGIVVSIPIMYGSIKTSLLSVPEELKMVAIEMGANERLVYRKISLPLARKGIITGTVLSIARIFGEFGATILVAGNIPGETQTVPMALYYAIENSDSGIATTILIVIVCISIALTLSYNFILRKMK
ncbi:molybdate ABC transporter permease subunit [uncultured Clostridium sp.]|uniref:molybdate ABC transporter permease subunit n=1 Tax=uncultured Clostridium sp. TaxID=59620 RepID=UPI00260CD349|nr:molybdate ABC transporter permease subunit [uncultured Clostridium sp.]